MKKQETEGMPTTEEMGTFPDTPPVGSDLLKAAISGAIEQGPRDHEEFMEYALLEFKGQDWVDRMDEAEMDEEADAEYDAAASLILGTCRAMGIDPDTGEYATEQDQRDIEEAEADTGGKREGYGGNPFLP